MNTFKFICIAVIFALMLSFTCFASDTDNSALIAANWSVDYNNKNDVCLTVDIQSDAGYIQNISIVMYDDEFDALSVDNKPAFDDYYHMDEIVLKKGETASVKFDISDEETPLTDGSYKILVQGSGKDAKFSTLQFPVWVINPSIIPGIISRFNNADASNIINCINEVKNTLRLDVKQSETAKRLTSFVNIKKK